jgi:hypothetical protein
MTFHLGLQLSYLVHILSLISGKHKYKSIEGIKKAAALNKVLKNQEAVLNMICPNLTFCLALHLKTPIKKTYQSTVNTI